MVRTLALLFMMARAGQDDLTSRPAVYKPQHPPGCYTPLFETTTETVTVTQNAISMSAPSRRLGVG